MRISPISPTSSRGSNDVAGQCGAQCAPLRRFRLMWMFLSCVKLNIRSPPRCTSDAARPRERGDRMIQRREFITLLGAVAWPLAARAQQASSPVVGLLSSGRLPESLIGIFRQGLAEQGYVEGRNVVIDYRHGDSKYGRLAGLAVEFVRREVAVIAALNSPP